MNKTNVSVLTAMDIFVCVFFSIHGFISCYQNQIFFLGGEGGICFLFGNVNFSVCESFKLERFTDRSESRCLTPRMKKKHSLYTLKCNMEPKTIMVWKIFFPFKMGDFQMNHVSFPFPGNQLPQGNKGLVDIWSTQILTVTTRCPSLKTSEASL